MSCVDINARDNDLITSEVFHKFAFPLFNARQPSGEGNVFSRCVYMSVCSPFTGLWPCAPPYPPRCTGPHPAPLYRAPSHIQSCSARTLLHKAPTVQDPGSSPPPTKTIPLRTCSVFFNFNQYPSPSPNMFKLTHYVARKVGKWMVVCDGDNYC